MFTHPYQEIRQQPVATEFVLLNLNDDKWTGREGMRAQAARFVDAAGYRRIYERNGIVLFRRED